MPQYVYYCLCRICHEVNTPDPPGICSKCQHRQKMTHRPSPLIRPPERSHYQTRRRAAKTGALPWQYAPEPGIFCRLLYEKWRITIRRDRVTRKFWYEIADGKESEYRRGIDNLASARIRSVRHLARMLNKNADDLMEEIRKNAKKHF